MIWTVKVLILKSLINLELVFFLSDHFSGLGDLFGPYFIDSIQWNSLHLPSPEKVSSKSDLASSFILGGSDQAGAKAKRRQAQKRKSDAQSNANTISPQASGSPVNKVCQSTFRIDEKYVHVFGRI